MADQTVRIDVIGSYSGGFSKAHRDLKRLGQSARHAADDVHPALTKLGNASAIAGTALLVGVGAAMAVGAKAAIDFESSFAGVRKTLEGSETQFSQLARGIRDMALEIPISVHELNRIAELGGQLGVPITAIEEFTEVIAKLGVTTNLETDEAATGLARFINVMGSSFSEIDNLGAGLVDLGNNFATTEAEILGFATRLAGIGVTVGLSEGDILGLAAAFTSLGEPVERGATAVQRTLIKMFQAVQTGGENLELFAEIAGQTTDQFAALFREDPVEAFLQFEEGLNRVNEAGGNTTGMLDDLGLGSQRTIGLLLKGATGYQLLRRGVENSNDAILANLALNEEAEKRFSTTESGLRLLANAFTDFRIEIGESTLGGIQSVARVLGELLRVLGENVDVFKEMMPLILALAGTKALGFLGNKFFDLGIKVGRSRPILRGFTKGLNRVMFAARALGFALTTAVFAIGAVATIMAVNRSRARAYNDSLEDLADTVEGFNEGTRTAKDLLEAFGQQLSMPTGIFDRTIDDLMQYGESFNLAGQSITQMVITGVQDIDAFNTEMDEGIAFWENRLLELQTIVESEDFSNLSIEEQLDIDAEMRAGGQYVFAVNEMAAAIANLRAEEARRRIDQALADPLPFFGGPFGLEIAGLPISADALLPGLEVEDAQEILDTILEETREFGSDFAEEWQEIIDQFDGRKTNWDSAWDDYERTARLSTSALRRSLGNYVVDQERMLAAGKFVLEDYGDDWFLFWSALPEDARAGMAATLALVGPNEFKKQFDEFIETWGALGAIALEGALLVAPIGAKRALDTWPGQFEKMLSENTPVFAEGTDEWVMAMMDNFGAFVGEQQPEVQGQLTGMLRSAIDETNAQLALTGQGIDFFTLTEGMDQIALTQLFFAMGFSWAESVALGWAAVNLPSKFATTSSEATEKARAEVERILENRSPSRVFMRIGQSVAEGFKLGVQSGFESFPSDLAMFQDLAALQTPKVQVDVSGIQPSGPAITINHPNHPTDDLTADLQRASVLAGFQRIAETGSIGNLNI